VDIVIVHIARDGLQRKLFEVVQNRAARHIAQMNHQVCIVTIALTNRPELIRYPAEMGI